MQKNIALKNIKIQDPFWTRRQQLIRDVVIPYQEKILNDQLPVDTKSHAIANFRIAAGLEEGEYYGMVFQDSDLAKWLEGVAYSLCISPDPELEARADEIIDTIAKAQQPDGYLNTYFTVKEPAHRWQNLLECHELYCAGHMMEAGAAYYEATGKRTLLDVMERMADHIDSIFGPGKRPGVPGHQEIEIGLMKLYRTTGKEKYCRLAQYFIDERGKDPDFFQKEAEKRDWEHFHMDPKDTRYNQSHLPVREQSVAVGHSVRAMYLYTAMADIAAHTGDKALIQACDRLWDNVTTKQMYVTGGIGSTAAGEAFTIDYDLPNDTVYAETCASIGLVFFARKMLNLHMDGKYGDVMERALYNGILSGMQMNGENFFYVNPLEVNQGVSGVLPGYRHVVTSRPQWYACACCPPNVVRLLMSFGQYAWGEDESGIYSHLFLGGEARLSHAIVAVHSKYPTEGDITYCITPANMTEAFTLAVRIPSHAKNVRIALNGRAREADAEHNSNDFDGERNFHRNGYLHVNRHWKSGDELRLTFDLPVRRIYANTAVRSDAGCVCLMRGPMVYCLESADNGKELSALRLPEDAPVSAKVCGEGILKDLVLLEAEGLRMHGAEELYSEQRPHAEKATLRAVPYFAWGNREAGDMRVWIPEWPAAPTPL